MVHPFTEVATNLDLKFAWGSGYEAPARHVRYREGEGYSLRCDSKGAWKNEWRNVSRVSR